MTCRVLGFSTQAYYAWKTAPLSRRDLDDAYLINAALDIHRDDRRSGTGSSPTNCLPTASPPG